MTKSILIVDDEDDVREITQLGLEMGTDWTVLTARSGAEALAVAGMQTPDAILLDMMMPGMDGRATLQRLKADEATRSIPVILVTAKAGQSNQEDFKALVIAGVIAKPFRPLKLAGEIAAILNWDL